MFVLSTFVCLAFWPLYWTSKELVVPGENHYFSSACTRFFGYISDARAAPLQPFLSHDLNLFQHAGVALLAILELLIVPHFPRDRAMHRLTILIVAAA
jgi:hypothetical protein